MIIITIYVIMAIIVATLNLINTMSKEKNNYLDKADLANIGLVSIFAGAFWCITVWGALVFWYVKKEKPFWAIAISDFLGLFTKSKGEKKC